MIHADSPWRPEQSGTWLSLSRLSVIAPRRARRTSARSRSNRRQIAGSHRYDFPVAMNTRCQPGDLALVLRSTDAGKIVTCLALADQRERAAFNIADQNGPVWRIDRTCMWNNWGEGEILLPYCPDAALLPIHPRPDLLDEEPMPDMADMDSASPLQAV